MKTCKVELTEKFKQWFEDAVDLGGAIDGNCCKCPINDFCEGYSSRDDAKLGCGNILESYLQEEAIVDDDDGTPYEDITGFVYEDSHQVIHALTGAEYKKVKATPFDGKVSIGYDGHIFEQVEQVESEANPGCLKCKSFPQHPIDGEYLCSNKVNNRTVNSFLNGSVEVPGNCAKINERCQCEHFERGE